MSAIEAVESLEGLLDAGRVWRRSNSTRELNARVARVAKGSPEVLVKITGFGKGGQHVMSHLSYISRHGKVNLETDRGEILSDKEAIKDLFKDWSAEFADSPRRKNQRDTVHMVLSMPEGTPQEAVRQGARSFARQAFGVNHEYVFALHTDEPHPHVHLTVKLRGHDGSRLNPRKADLQRWRQHFAEKMRDEGIDAEATPRAVRGRVKKAERQVVRHIERGDKTHAPRVPRVKAAQIRQAARELAAVARGEALQAKPWEAAIKTRQAAVRSAWIRAADALEAAASRPAEEANVPPDYDRIDPQAARAGQRAAVVYHSHLERTRRKAPAEALARVRNLSGLGVVHDQRPAQVLLLAHAPGGVGRDGGADPALRRQGTGLAEVAGGGRVAPLARLVAPAQLARQLRAFVAAMPDVQTQRQLLMRQLADDLGRTGERAEERGLIPSSRADREAER